MQTTQQIDINTYIETPRQQGTLVKIDEILEARLKAFMKARRIRRFTFLK